MTQKESIIANACAFGMALTYGITDRAEVHSKIKTLDLLIKSIGRFQRSTPSQAEMYEASIRHFSQTLNLVCSIINRSVTLYTQEPEHFSTVELDFPFSKHA